MQNNQRFRSLGLLVAGALLSQAALGAEPASATAELRGCVRASGPLPAGLKAVAIAVTQTPPEQHPLPFNGACYAATLPKGIYLVRADAPGLVGKAPLVQLNAPAQRDLKLIPEKGSNPALADRLAELARADQDARQNIDLANPAAIKKMIETDKQNQKELRRILETYGWPDAELVGYAGAHHAWLLVQHAPDQVIKRLLPAMKAAAERGDLYAGNVALNIDRVLVSEGKKQLYGSQFRQTQSGGLQVQPIEDPKHLDERRAKMGMEPFAQYRAMVMQANQAPKQR
ncbi:hypothetical protein NX774_09380 [Massilia agilis]|uniref:Uncharacterized protein n=1 Tax=Massilia agilis TaxID=1811226 RepID=A0ABT2DCJ1_9BURK|nr:DUF6624 domain-containing protein [Massilia agilis]MCS0808128.1 hypothetical protein [Massilia agilis]